MAPSTLRSLTMSLRGFQFVFSTIALATIAAGFITATSRGYSVMLGSNATNFAMLMTYTTMLYSLYDLVVVEHFEAMPRLASRVQLCLNVGFAFILFTAGLVLATSDYVKNCDDYTGAVRCGSLTAGTVFTFLAATGFIGSAALPFMNLEALNKANENVDEAAYAQADVETTKNTYNLA